MPPGDQKTKTAVFVPTVLAISCSQLLLTRCVEAVASTGTVVRSCDLAGAATAVAQRRPLVIVVPQDVYARDPAEVDALARDVGASLLRVAPDITEAMLELLLGAAVDTALTRRRDQAIAFARADDARAAPPSWRKTVPRRRPSLPDIDGPPSSERAPT